MCQKMKLWYLKNKGKFWLAVVVGYVLICGLVIAALNWSFNKRMEVAQDRYITRLEASLKEFPTLEKMHAYGEFYLRTEDAEYLIVKTGDTLLLGERTDREIKYYESAADARHILDAVAAEIKARLATDGTYFCEKVAGRWKLNIMPDSEWLVTCMRVEYLQEEFITHIQDGENEQIGWVVYDDYDDVELYVFLNAELAPEHKDGIIFGWGELPEEEME